jgi:hypothetical protein
MKLQLMLAPALRSMVAPGAAHAQTEEIQPEIEAKN